MLARAAIAKESPGKKAAHSSPSPKSAGYSSVVDEMESDFPAPKYSWSFADIPLHAPNERSRVGAEAQPPPMRMPLLPIQAKLEAGAVDDPLEREADRVAEQVMRMPEPVATNHEASPHASAKGVAGHPTASEHGALVQRKCSCGGSCDKCKSEQSDDEHGKLQRKPDTPQISRVASSSATMGMEAPPIVHEVLRSPGQPLDAATRAFFEPRFGYDLSMVRVHADAKAAESAEAIQARAYTVRGNLVFASGQISPRTDSRRRLLGHELTHVIQQAAGTTRIARQPAPKSDKPTKDKDTSQGTQAGQPSVCSNFDPSKLQLPRSRNGADFFGESNNGIRFLMAVPAKQSSGVRKAIPAIANQITNLNAILPDAGGRITVAIVTPSNTSFRLLCGQPALLIDPEHLTAETAAHETMHGITSALLAQSRSPDAQGMAAANFLSKMADIYLQLNQLKIQIAPDDIERATNLVDPHTLDPKEAPEHPQDNVDEFVSSAVAVYLTHKKELGKKIEEFGKKEPKIRVTGHELINLLDSVVGKHSLPPKPLPGVSTDKEIASELQRVQPTLTIDDATMLIAPLLSELLQPSAGQQATPSNPVQKKSATTADLSDLTASPAPPLVYEVVSSAGRPLDASTRAFFEPRFGRDLSHVRIHTDHRAAESARAIRAQAYAVGSDVVFASGCYAPTGRDGQRLLAHELAHVVQQRASGGNGAIIPIGVSGSIHECEADQAVHQMMRGAISPPLTAAPLQLSRQPRLTIVDDESGLTDKQLAVIVVDAKKALDKTTQHSKNKAVKAGIEISYQRGLKDIEKLVKRGDVIVYVIGAAKGQKTIPQDRMEKIVQDIVAAQHLPPLPHLNPDDLSKSLAEDLKETVNPKTGVVSGQSEYNPQTSVSIVNVDLISKRDPGGLRAIAGDILHEGPGHRAFGRGYHNPVDKGVMSKSVLDSATENEILFQADEWDAVNTFLEGIVANPHWNG